MSNQTWRWSGDIRGGVRFWLAEQPMVTHFRWDHHTWGSTWHFPLLAIAFYLLLILLLKILLIPRKRPLPLGPIPAIHNLCVVLASVAIFLGCWEATAVELRETRWIWSRKFKNATEWVMCFPLGTRPSGRVFFWSYIFYLTKYHQLFDTVIWILRKKPLIFLHVFHRVAVVFVCYAWLEFSQSLQIVTILATTLLYVVVYSYFLCRSIGWGCWSSFLPANCQCWNFNSNCTARQSQRFRKPAGLPAPLIAENSFRRRRADTIRCSHASSVRPRKPPFPGRYSSCRLPRSGVRIASDEVCRPRCAQTRAEFNNRARPNMVATRSTATSNQFCVECSIFSLTAVKEE